MASITPRKNKDGKVISYKIRVSRGRGLKPYETSWKVPDTMTSQRTIKAAVQRFAADFEKECREGFVPTEKRTFSEYAESVLATKENAKTLKPKTIARYRELMKRINDVNLFGIGHMQLCDVRADNLNRFYKELSKPGLNMNTGEGLSPKTILEYHRFISSILEQAKREQLIRYNPCDAATKPKVPKRKRVEGVDFYSPELIEEIITCLDNEDIEFRAFMLLMIVSGARRGEILGLTWDCIDWDNKLINVEKTVQYLPEKGVFVTSTKTDETRKVTITSQNLDLLKEWKKVQKANTKLLSIKDNGFVFTGLDGVSVLHPDSVSSKLDSFSKKNNLPHLHSHAFRHSAASFLISKGLDIASVSKHLGHANISTTLNIYADAFSKANEQISNLFETELLGKAAN